MQLSVENVRPYSVINGIFGIRKSKKVNSEPETKLLPQQNKVQLNISQMADLIEQTNSVSRDVNSLIFLMKMELKDGVTDADKAALQVIKDIATGKIDFEKIKESPNNGKFKVEGANGKTYGVLVTIQDEKVTFWAAEGSSADVTAFVSGEAHKLCFENAIFSNTKVLKALPEFYSEKTNSQNNK